MRLREVAGFLMRRGLGGVRLGTKPFKRWLFGEYQEFPAPVRTVLYLLVALGVIAALAFLNALIVAIAVARAPLRTSPAWLGDAMFQDVTTVLNALVVALVPFAFLMGCWALNHRMKQRLRIPGWLTVPALFVAVWATLASALAAGVVVLYHAGVAGDLYPSFFETVGLNPQAFNDRFDAVLQVVMLAAAGLALLPWVASVGRSRFRRFKDDRRSLFATVAVLVAFGALAGSLAMLVLRLVSHPNLPRGTFASLKHGLAWPLVIAAAAVVRRFLIQYAGDVAAYLQPQVVDRFFELRKEIKNVVWKAVRAVYRQTEYHDIVPVGHSLGSVVVYDALNRRLIDRALDTEQSPEVVTRTRLLLTFGSPLDKTAFMFGTQSNGTEALAALVQPLITEPSLRPAWVNIYSNWDIIGGKLDYYDPVEGPKPHAVINIKDDKATTLLAAHVEHWRNPKVFETIIEVLS